MKFLLLQSLAIPVIQLLFDLIIRSVWISKGGSKWDAGVFLLGLLACWALSFTFLSVVSMLRRWNKWAMLFATSLFALWHTLVLTTNFFLFHFFGEYLFPGAFAFIFDKDYMLDYIRTFSGIVPIMSLLGLWGFFFLCVRPWKKSEVRYALLVPMTVVILAAGIVALHANDKKSEFRMPPDMVAVESLSKHFLRVRDHALPLYPSKRLPVWSFPGTTPPHTVLIIVHESMGTRSLPFMEGYLSHGSPEGGMPRLTQRMQQDSAGFIIFQRAYTNAVSTMVSMPSIFSGVSPEESYDKLHCMPLLWDMAKDAGYKTAYFSSQRLRWATMNDFLRKEPIDSLVGREQTDYPPVNDMGIDDFHIVTTLETWLAAHPKDPLFVVWNTNALHVPHQASSEYIDLSKIPGTRYEKALYLLDSADERVFRALENAGRMDEALIVSTADHGENPEPPHPIARIKSYYEEFIRIPLWVHLPRSMRGGVEEQAMRARIKIPVANMDIAPSLGQLWGVKPNLTAGSSMKDCPVNDGHIPWLGESLFNKSTSPDRIITSLSTNITRPWEGDGFGLIHSHWRVVLLPDSGRQIFDIDEDPGETRNLWNSVADSIMAPFRARIEGNAYLNDIHTHHRNREKSSK